MDALAFREAAPAPVEELSHTGTSPEETGGVVADTTPPVDEMPPSLWVEAHRPPLFLEEIGATAAYRHFDMESISNEVDRLIVGEVARLGLPDTAEEYAKVVADALTRLHFPEGLDSYAKIEALARYFRVQHKLWSALREKEELMAADPTTLSATKLRRYLELHGR